MVSNKATVSCRRLTQHEVLENTADNLKPPPSQSQMKSCETLADKWDMLFVFMFAVAGIFVLIMVK